MRYYLGRIKTIFVLAVIVLLIAISSNSIPQYQLINNIKKQSIHIIDTANYYQGLSQWLIFLTAIFTILYARKTFFLQKRPYIDVKLQHSINTSNNDWNFMMKLTNKGNYPGIAKVSFCELKVGDNIYPSNFLNDFVIFPDESSISPQIGYINQAGITRIKNNGYISNTVEIKVEILSTEINSNHFEYRTFLHVSVDVFGVEPQYRLHKHEVI